MGTDVPKISLLLVQQGMAFARQQGVAVDAILARRGLDLPPLPSDPSCIALRDFERALEALWLTQPERRYPCLSDSELIGRSAYGPITQLFLNAPSVGAAIQDFREFAGLFGNPGTLEFEHHPGNLVIRWRSGFTIPMVRENLTDFLFGSAVLIFGMITSPEPLPVRYATLRRRKPANRSDLELFARAYRCPVTFDAEADSLVLAPEVLSMRSSVGDGFAYQAMRQVFRQQLLAMTAANTFAESVRETVRNMDARAGISRATVASRLGLSERQMNRRLAAEGLTYIGIVEGVRYERAREYLVAGGTSLKAVASDLGFAESNSFSRWFRKMAGITPSEFRQRSAGSPPAS
jgi:AraC-like DNA-binding protein